MYGSPRYNNYSGAVTIDKTDFSRYKQKTGSTFSSRFGQSVCFIDFDGDGKQEKVVGSPLHSNSKVRDKFALLNCSGFLADYIFNFWLCTGRKGC